MVFGSVGFEDGKEAILAISAIQCRGCLCGMALGCSYVG